MKTTQFNFTKLISTVKYLGVATVFVAGLATFSGCAKKGCTDTTADNYDVDATEDDASCIPARDKFLGTYTMSGTVACPVTGNGTIGATATPISTSSAGPLKITMTLGTLPLVATVSGSTLTIDNQTIGGFVYTGNGTINGSLLNVTINEEDASVPETCVYTLSGSK